MTNISIKEALEIINNKELKPEKTKSVVPTEDDILVYLKTFENHNFDLLAEQRKFLENNINFNFLDVLQLLHKYEKLGIINRINTSEILYTIPVDFTTKISSQ